MRACHRIVGRSVAVKGDRPKVPRNPRRSAAVGIAEGKQHQQMLGHVADIIKLWTQERRNDLSAEAIAEFFRMPELSVEVVTGLITELRASGEYDRIVAKSNSGS
jgi:hypothetical protein